MPKITLLQIKSFTYKDDDHLERLIRRHKAELSEYVKNLKDPKASAAINAIAYNMIQLMREREKYNRQKAKLLVLDGGKKD